MVSRFSAAGPMAIFTMLWHHRSLVWRLTLRELDARYRGSILGGLWTFLLPLMLLGVYTFVFGVVFRARWEVPPGGQGNFPLIIFAGMLAVTIFTDCLARAPSLILENPTYIKKVVFPVEILPWVVLAGSILTALFSLCVLFVAYLVALGLPPLTAFWLPVVLLPLLLLSLGVMWIISSLGTYLRDLRPAVGMAITVLVFMCPLFYPISNVPEQLRWAIFLNPLTIAVEQVRQVLFWGQTPNLWVLGGYTLGAWVFAWMGLIWFRKMQRGFADVI